MALMGIEWNQCKQPMCIGDKLSPAKSNGMPYFRSAQWTFVKDEEQKCVLMHICRSFSTFLPDLSTISPALLLISSMQRWVSDEARRKR